MRGLEGGLTGQLTVCRGCKLGKPLGKPHPSKSAEFRARNPQDLVHADLAGPISPGSWGRGSYVFVLLDDYSRKSWVMVLKQKPDAEMRLKEWVAIVERESGHKSGRFRTDNGGEFTKQSLKDWLKLRGVRQEFTPPRTPQAKPQRCSGAPEPHSAGQS